jgi:Conserved TM helix
MQQQVLASVNFSGGFSSAWNSIANFVPKFIGFLVVLAIGWFIARVLARALDKVLRRVGFERMAERGGISKALADSKYDTTSLTCKIVYYALLLVTLQLGFGIFGTNPISTMINSVVAWLPKGLVALVIVVVAAAIARVVRDLVGSALSSLSYGNKVATVASVFVLALGIFAALGQAGIATTVTGPVLIAVLATMAGILIVGVGGGLVQPMRQRWESMLDAAEREGRNASASINAYQQGRSDAMSGQTAGQMSGQMAGAGAGQPTAMAGGTSTRPTMPDDPSPWSPPVN